MKQVYHYTRQRFAKNFLLLIVLLTGMSFMGRAQKLSASLEQWRSHDGTVKNDGDGEWSKGDINHTNSHYEEGFSVPYRSVIDNLQVNQSISLIISFQITRNNPSGDPKHALDYITSFNRSKAADALEGVSGTFGSPNEYILTSLGLPSTNPPDVSGLTDAEKTLTLYGGEITDVSYYPPVGEGDLGLGNQYAFIKITFTPSQSKAVLLWGGHLALSSEWNGLGAGTINGSPYHMRLDSWLKSDDSKEQIGSQDVQIQITKTEGCDLPEPCENDLYACETSSGSGKAVFDLSQSTCATSSGWYTDIDFEHEIEHPESFEAEDETTVFSKVENSCGYATIRVTLHVNATPTIYTLTATDYCENSTAGGSLTLSGHETGVDYTLQKYNGSLWDDVVSTPSVDGTNLVWSGLFEGTYKVVAANSETDCSSETDDVDLHTKPIPDLTVQNLSNVCPYNTVNLANAILTAGTGTISYYQSNGTTLVSNPNAVGAGTYVIKLLGDNGCTNEKTITVTVNICQGCTPGYWKNRKATWNTIKTTSDELTCINSAAGISYTGELKNASFWTVFGLSSLTKAEKEARTGKGTENLTLIQALGLGDGSGYTQLGRAATAALLNSCALTGSGAYPYSGSSIVTNTKNIFAASISNQTRQQAIDLAKVYDIANNNNCTLDNAIKAVQNPVTSVSEQIHELGIMASPNPYTNKVRFIVNVPEGGQGSLEVFNMLGQKVKTVFQGYLQAGSQTFDLSIPAAQRTSLIYQFRVGDKQITGKLLQMKE